MVKNQLDIFSDIPLRVIIEKECPTQRAASLVEVAPSTLCRSYREGQRLFRHHAWEVEFSKKQGKQYFWRVLFCPQ